MSAYDNALLLFANQLFQLLTVLTKPLHDHYEETVGKPQTLGNSRDSMRCEIESITPTGRNVGESDERLW